MTENTYFGANCSSEFTYTVKLGQEVVTKRVRLDANFQPVISEDETLVRSKQPERISRADLVKLAAAA